MAVIEANIFWILIASGLFTAAMLAGAVAPNVMAAQTFGTVPDRPLGYLLMRCWAWMVGTSGVLLVYAAFDEAVRVPVIAFSVGTKLVFAGSVAAAGAPLAEARPAAIIDTVISVLLIGYLLA